MLPALQVDVDGVVVLRVRALLLEELLELLGLDFSLDLLSSLAVLKIVHGFLNLWAQLLPRLLVVPEDVALEGHADAAHSEPYAHVQEVVRLCANDRPNRVKLG